MDTEMAKEILSAIEIANSECDGFWELHERILGHFPEIVEERRLQAIKIEEICAEQKRGKQLVIAKFSKDVSHPTVAKAIEWYLANERFIRDNYSDEICFAGEMWESLPKPQLKEMIVSLRAIKPTTEFERNVVESIERNTDDNLWHNLIKFLDHATYLERVKKSKRN